MGRKNNIKQGASWTVIILCLIFFFYAGIPLMLMKLHRDKANMLTNAKRTAVVGWIIFGLGVIYLIAGVTGGLAADDTGSIVFGVVVMVALCCGGGYAIVRNAKKYKKLGLTYERYLPVVSGSPNGSLDDIAEVLGETYDTTSENVQKLIDAGMFENSYIDKTRRCLVSPAVSSTFRPQSDYPAVEANYNRQHQNRAIPKKIKTVKCPNCGGVNNVTEGAENLCDFCGSPFEF